VEAHFIVAACENMVSAEAMRPGDILTASNGKTIEVINTDAGEERKSERECVRERERCRREKECVTRERDTGERERDEIERDASERERVTRERERER
jgi:hypothetical protein